MQDVQFGNPSLTNESMLGKFTANLSYRAWDTMVSARASDILLHMPLWKLTSKCGVLITQRGEEGASLRADDNCENSQAWEDKEA